jgi:hypothetical protein
MALPGHSPADTPIRNQAQTIGSIQASKKRYKSQVVPDGRVFKMTTWLSRTICATTTITDFTRLPKHIDNRESNKTHFLVEPTNRQHDTNYRHKTTPTNQHRGDSLTS